MYVTLYNPGGAAGAATAVQNQLTRLTHAPHAHPWIVNAMDRFVDSSGSYAGIFAATMRETGDESTEEQLRTDASVAARRFLAGIGPTGP